MTLFFVNQDDAEIFDTASLTAPSVPVPRDTEVEAIPAPNPNFQQVTAMHGPPARTGFMRTAALQSADAPPEAIPDDRTLFFNQADSVARELGVDRDYLVAMAWAATQGLAQLGTATGPAMGPFMFTVSNWRAAIASPRAPIGVRLTERNRWALQVRMAAIVALDANDALTAALGKPPTLGMLYFAHIFGTAAAIPLLADMARPFDAAYTAALGPALLAACHAEHADLLGTPGVLIRDVFDGLCRKLDAGYLAAAAILDRQTDAIRFFHAEDDDPRWLMVAREEAFRGVFEQPGADNNARIVEYLRASGLTASTDEVPWCAAFVTYCMQQAGLANTVPHDPARAVSWLSWGHAAPAGLRAPGMVVVLKPQVPNSSGHVGFLLQDPVGSQPPPGMLRLLAGNQGTPQRVCALDVKEDQVAGFRTLTAMPTPAPPPIVPAAPGQAGTFRSLVAGGFFSANPNDQAVKRSIRTNNPGALNRSNWQRERKGFFGETQPDFAGNITTIYLTPEHGVASWYTLIAKRYGLGPAYGLRTLAAHYAGLGRNPAPYITAWVQLSHGGLTPDTIIDTSDDARMLILAKAMFHHESGVATPLQDAQILFAIHAERTGTLPA